MATTLKRTQMYFPDDMLRQVRQLAASEHSTIAEIVRSAVSEFWDSDPLWGIVGQAASTDGDLAVNHDVYLYGGEK
jgi:hypothetical protein